MCCKPCSRLVNQADGFAGQHFAAASGDLFERLALQILHDDEIEARGDAGLERANDVGVFQPQGETGFAMEAAEQVGFLGLGGRQHLDGDDLAERVLRLVNAGHAALA